MAIKKGIFNAIQIIADGTTYTLPRPSGFTVEREEVYAGELTTCTGNYYADRIGWKYADMDLTWEILEPADLDNLLVLPSVVTLRWTDANGSNRSDSVRITKRAATGTRFTKNNRLYWKDVSLGVSFNGVHTD